MPLDRDQVYAKIHREFSMKYPHFEEWAVRQVALGYVDRKLGLVPEIPREPDELPPVAIPLELFAL